MAMGTRAGNSMPPDRVELLDRAWSEAAQLYLQELVPRFDPWLQSALRELHQHELPPGPILVPCCGPGHELVQLHALYGGRRRVVGLDLSRGMVELAGEAIAAHLAHRQQLRQGQKGLQGQMGQQGQEGQRGQQPQPQPQPQRLGVQAAAAVEAEAGAEAEGAEAAAEAEAGPPSCGAAGLEAHVADASCLDELEVEVGHGPAAAVLSVFGLQQMGALAPQALASWGRCLAPGGVGVVVLWPSAAEGSGPWVTFDQVVREKAAADAGREPPPADAAARAGPAEWEVRLTEQLLQQPPGEAAVELLVDRLEPHAMEWESLEQFWRVMTEGGPWRARRLAQGDAAMEELWVRFAAKYRGVAPGAGSGTEAEAEAGTGSGAGEGGEGGSAGRLVHSPSARVLVFRRAPQPGGPENAPAAAQGGPGAGREGPPADAVRGVAAGCGGGGPKSAL